MKKFICWMSSGWGRGLRVVIGIGCIGTGLMLVTGGWGLALALFGLLPLTTGVFNLCPISPFLGLPFVSAKLNCCGQGVGPCGQRQSRMKPEP